MIFNPILSQQLSQSDLRKLAKVADSLGLKAASKFIKDGEGKDICCIGCIHKTAGELAIACHHAQFQFLSSFSLADRHYQFVVRNENIAMATPVLTGNTRHDLH